MPIYRFATTTVCTIVIQPVFRRCISVGYYIIGAYYIIGCNGRL